MKTKQINKQMWQVGCLGGLLILLLLISFQLASAAPGDIERVSIHNDGTEGNNGSNESTMSNDGRYVAFHSDASTLVDNDTNGVRDVFVHDRNSGLTTRISQHSDGTEGNGNSLYPFISGDGRYVTFYSAASNIADGDTNGQVDVIVHDRQTGINTIASVHSDGTQGDAGSTSTSISDDGRYVAFSSSATNLINGDTNGLIDIFVRDRVAGTTIRISETSGGADSDGNGLIPRISGNGHYITYYSGASNLVANDTNARRDIFVHDLQTSITTRVSVSTAGVEANHNSERPGISDDGRYVAFQSDATNLVANDTNARRDIFVHDRNTGTTTRVSVHSDGTESDHNSISARVSGDGRFVGYESSATNIVDSDTNGSKDTFVHELPTSTTTLRSVDSSGAQGDHNSHHPSFNYDGSVISFQSRATNLVTGDTNGHYDTFVVGEVIPSGGATDPVLSVADATIDASNGTMSVPVDFVTNGADVASLAFSLDYQESCLSYASYSGIPADFSEIINHDGADTDGELDISLFDATVPIGTLSDGTLLSITFNILPACITTDGTTTDAIVGFSSDPAPSLGGTDSGEVPSVPPIDGTITMEFNATPTDIALSATAIDENVAIGTAVGSLFTTDIDVGDTHTYALVAGAGDADNASFTVEGDEIKTAVDIDFETQNSFSIRVRTTDDGGLNGTFEKQFTIIANDLNEAPTDIVLSNSSVNENEVVDTVVGSLSSTDEDAGDSHTYALVAGAGDDDNASFTIDAGQIKTSEIFNFEVKNGYSVRVESTDSGSLTFEKQFTITIVDVNDTPVAQDDTLDPTATVVVGTQSASVDVLANDSDEDGDTLTVDALTQPAAGSSTDNDSDVTFTAPGTNGSQTFTYQATDGSLNSNTATVTVFHVEDDLRGDCNNSGSVTAGDFIATILEIFDAGSDLQYNGNPAWWQIYAGGYAGSPIGCDANASENGVSNDAESVTIADVTCMVSIFFGNSSCVDSGSLSTLNKALPASLGMQQAGDSMNVVFNARGNAVASAAFALVLDPAQIGFDATDADGNGIPDTIMVNAPTHMQRIVIWDAERHELQVAIFSISASAAMLEDGVLATVTLNTSEAAAEAAIVGVSASRSAVRFGHVSLGSVAGADVAVQAVDPMISASDVMPVGTLPVEGR
ncbi:MAG: Ig-like domain-containing protein [Chloroflexota bacterium]